MAQTVKTLIIEALRQSNVINYNASVNQDKIDVCVPIINDILIEWGIDISTVPYSSVFSIPLIANQFSYTFGNDPSFTVNTNPIIDIITLTFSDRDSGIVIYHPIKLTETYFANLNFGNITGIPQNYLLRIFEDYSEVILYPTPVDNTLDANFVVKQRINQIESSFIDLSFIPQRIRTALKGELRIRTSRMFGIDLSESEKSKLEESVKNLRAINFAEYDLTLRKDESLSNQSFYNDTFWGFKL